MNIPSIPPATVERLTKAAAVLGPMAGALLFDAAIKAPPLALGGLVAFAEAVTKRGDDEPAPTHGVMSAQEHDDLLRDIDGRTRMLVEMLVQMRVEQAALRKLVDDAGLLGGK